MSDSAPLRRLKTKVSFRWECESVAPDEEVWVVGNCDQLGNWDPAKGIRLQRNESITTCWSSPNVSLFTGEQVEYKYTMCNVAPGSSARWEWLWGNRSLIPTGLRQIVEDDNGKLRDVVEAREATLQSFSSFSGPVNSTAERMERKASQDLSEFRKSSRDLSELSEKPGDAMPKIQSFDMRLKREKENQVTSTDDVLVVFRSLPVKVERGDNGWTVDAEATKDSFKVVSLLWTSMQNTEQRSFKIRFVGDPGVRTSDPEERKQIADLLAGYSCVPVFIDADVAEKHLSFCHKFLWPVLHGMKVFEDELTQLCKEERTRLDLTYRDYQVWNRRYAETVETLMTPSSLVWVHDFYLLLMPKYLIPKRPDARVGFFLHAAFPSSEVLRCIPMREEILQSLLSCKIVAFQAFEYTRHFLSGCQLLLNSGHSIRSGGVLCIEHQGRSIILRQDHFVIPVSNLVAHLGSDQVQSQARAIRERFGNRKIIASIDGDEPFSGLMLKLRAFQRLLADCPQHVRGVVLLQHILDRKIDAGSNLMKDLRKEAEETNRTYGVDGPVVVIEEGDLDIKGRLAILQAADVLFDTSINDGLNVNPWVFCVAHSKEMRGSMIVSEFIGSSFFLTGARKINPWNTEQVMNTLHEVLVMDEEEQRTAFRRDQSYVSTQNLGQWVTQNLNEIKVAASSDANKGLEGSVVATSNMGMMLMKHGVHHLNFDWVSSDFRAAKTRVIFLDVEGTLAPDKHKVLRPFVSQKLTNENLPSLDPKVLECLQQLVNDRPNYVTVLSGREKSVVDNWFRSVPGIGMCAEHGFHSLLPEKLQQKGGVGTAPPGWQCMGSEEALNSDDWKKIAKALMEQYAKRVQGSIVEFKGSAITWNYSKVSAQQICKEIAAQLERFLDPDGPDSFMHGYPIRVAHGKGYVEVRHKDVDKGIAVRRILDEITAQHQEIDFILCIGDDRSDEHMFDAIAKFATDQEQKHELMSGCSFALRKKRCASKTFEENHNEDGNAFYSVTVGRKATKAGYYVREVGEVSELLQRLASQAIKSKMSRFSSMPNFSYAREDDDDEFDS